MDLAEQAGDEESTEPSFPARSNDRSKPVLLVHGFNLNPLNMGAPASDPTTWTNTKALLAQHGWSGPVLTYGYYGCDAGFDRHVSNHGSHDSGVHSHQACGPGGHDLDTSIEHLAQHFAWAVYDEFAVEWRCVDVVAHSMGGLVVRYALHGVEHGLAGFPPELCIEDAITLGTPHNGAGVLGELCAAFLAYAQCVQMTDYEGFLYEIGQKAATPQGTAQTDWTAIGSFGDATVYFDSAVSMASHQKILFLDAIITHIGATGYQLAPLEGLHRVRFFDATNGGLVMTQAPGPLAWVLEALEHDAYRFAQGSPPPLPHALRVAPQAAEGGVIPGQIVQFEAGCQNAQKDLLGGEWWTRSGDGAWIPEGFDSVQIDATPWLKTRTISFDVAGSYGVRFQCVNEYLATSAVEWTIQADPSFNDPPTAQRTEPVPASATATERMMSFQGSCRNPNADLAKAQWQIQSPGSTFVLWEEDTVQLHADPWHTGTTIEFAGEGTHTVRLACFDEHGATAHVDWTVQYERPSGPTAYRYAPTANSVTVASGDAVEFEAGCSNPDDRLNRGEWWTRIGNGAWQLDDQDYVQFSTDPWIKSREYTFTQPGSYGIQFRCVNEDGGEGQVEWSVNAQ